VARIAAYLAEVARRLIIEFVPADDPQAQRISVARQEGWHSYSRDEFEKVFRDHFDILEVAEVEESGRRIYFMDRRKERS
jgi:hypothetical protein